MEGPRVISQSLNSSVPQFLSPPVLLKFLKNPKASTILSASVSAVFLIGAAISVLLTYSQMRGRALSEAESKAKVILDRNLATHAYYTHQLKPRLFKSTEPIQSPDTFEPTWMSSTYAVREIDKYFHQLNPAGYYYKECAVNARSPENEADAHEKAFLAELNRDPAIETRSSIRRIDGADYLAIMRRGETMEESCLRCHSSPDRAPAGLVSKYGSDRSFGRATGEVVSAISIRVPLAEAYAAAEGFALRLATLYVILLFAVIGLIYWLNRRFVLHPLGLVRDEALLIAGPEDRLGDPIPEPRVEELKELVQAFNTMSTELEASRAGLERRVQDRTAALSEARDRLEREIAERKRTDEELRSYHERLEQVVAERTGQLSGRVAEVERLNQAMSNLLEDLLASNRSLEKATARTQEVNEELRCFTYSVTHDLRAPLRNIQALAEALGEDFGDLLGPVGLEYTDRMEHAAGSMDVLIQDLLAYSRMVREELLLEEVHLHEVVVKALEELRSQIDGSGATVEILDVLPVVRGHERALRQVVANLVSNAVKFVEAGVQPEIRIWAEERDGGTRLWVEDKGIGIPPERKGEIFGMLTRLHGAETYPGTGIGLAIVARGIDRLGGKAGVESEPGKGSRFWVELPRS